MPCSALSTLAKSALNASYVLANADDACPCQPDWSWPLYPFMLDCSPRITVTADSTCCAAVAIAALLTADSPVAMRATSLSLVI
jgi:hypothetical protein